MEQGKQKCKEGERGARLQGSSRPHGTRFESLGFGVKNERPLETEELLLMILL